MHHEKKRITSLEQRMTRRKRENLWWPKRAAASIAVLLVVAAFTTPSILRADGDASSSPNIRVTVRCNQPQVVAGLPLRVLVADSGHTDLLPIEEPHTFNASGEAVVSLRPASIALRLRLFVTMAPSSFCIPIPSLFRD